MPNRYLSAGAIFAGAFILFASGSILAQQQPKFDFGKREYVSNCAVCHGLTGKGDGVYKELLNKSPSDLTSIAKANQGVFPYQKVYEIIDGRQQVKAHGPGDMPIWGAEYRAKSATDYLDVPYNPEWYVWTRITALVEYVYRLQAK
jgi:mono/diheme cytochrome c family protein